MGGQLRIHLETEEVGESNQGGRGQTWDIEPVLDRLVLFRSDLVDHEVRYGTVRYGTVQYSTQAP